MLRGDCRIEPALLVDNDTVLGALYSEYSWRLLRQQANNNNGGEEERIIAIALVEIRGRAPCQLIAKKYHEKCRSKVFNRDPLSPREG
jgi:hypothetical protein